MSKKAVICVAHCRNLAELIVDQLRFYNLSNGDISILYPDEERNGRKTHHFGYDGTGGTDEVAGAGHGQAVGGTVGWIRGIGPLALPGVGAFIAAGPIKAFLSAAGAGATTRGIAGGLIGLGVCESQAKLYEARIRLGNILICMHTENPTEAMQAKFIFTRARAQDICITVAALPEPEVEMASPQHHLPAAALLTYWPALQPHPAGLNPGLAET